MKMSKTVSCIRIYHNKKKNLTKSTTLLLSPSVVRVTAAHQTLSAADIIRRCVPYNAVDVTECYQHLLTGLIPSISLKWQVWRRWPTIETMAFILILFQLLVSQDINRGHRKAALSSQFNIILPTRVLLHQK